MGIVEKWFALWHDAMHIGSGCILNGAVFVDGNNGPISFIKDGFRKITLCKCGRGKWFGKRNILHKHTCVKWVLHNTVLIDLDDIMHGVVAPFSNHKYVVYHII